MGFFLSLITSSSAQFTKLQNHSKTVLWHFILPFCERKNPDLILLMSERDGGLFILLLQNDSI